MSKADIEIYVTQLIRFFETNPNDLTSLIGGLNKEIFYSRIREAVTVNDQNGENLELTRKQLIDIVVTMFNEAKTDKTSDVTYVSTVTVMRTKFGSIFLN